jgi:hypothetical protein
MDIDINPVYTRGLKLSKQRGPFLLTQYTLYSCYDKFVYEFITVLSFKYVFLQYEKAGLYLPISVVGRNQI